MSKTTTYNLLRIEAAEADISLNEVCRRAGINRQTIQKWREKEPHTLALLSKIRAEIKKAKDEKAAEAV
jgi:transcriptional regulator with XRE-family HTH domain